MESQGVVTFQPSLSLFLIRKAGFQHELVQFFPETPQSKAISAPSPYFFLWKILNLVVFLKKLAIEQTHVSNEIL